MMKRCGTGEERKEKSTGQPAGEVNKGVRVCARSLAPSRVMKLFPAATVTSCDFWPRAARRGG